MSKYSDVIQKARKQAKQEAKSKGPKPQAPKISLPQAGLPQAGLPQAGLPQVREPEVKEEEVNLSIKVPRRLRRHWAAEAKRLDTTLTATVIAALKDKFGEPESES